MNTKAGARALFRPFFFTNWLALALVCLLLGACAGKDNAAGEQPPPAPPPPQPAENPQDVVWAFAPKALHIAIQADAKANAVRELPHAVSLCIYQTASPAGLQAKAATKEGLAELLQCRSVPPDSVQADHYYVQPGATLTFTLDRAEGARYLAVVAGFDSLEPASCFAVQDMPIHTETFRTWTLLSTYSTYSAASMNVDIRLQSSRILLKGWEHDL